MKTLGMMSKVRSPHFGQRLANGAVAQEKLKRNRNHIVRLTYSYPLGKARLLPVASGESRCNYRDRL